jgi:hypothetical protein
MRRVICCRSASTHRSRKPRQKHPGVLPVLHKPFSKFLRQKRLLPSGLAIKRQQHKRKSNHSTQQSLDHRRRQQRCQHSRIDRMANPTVRPAPNQLMVGLNRHRATPVASQNQPRPHREQQSENRYCHAENQQHWIRWPDRLRQPRSAKPLPENQHESQYRGNKMLNPLRNTLPSFRGLAEKRHRQPPQRPDRPCSTRKIKRPPRGKMQSARQQLQKRVSGNSHEHVLEEFGDQRRCTSIAKIRAIFGGAILVLAAAKSSSKMVAL